MKKTFTFLFSVLAVTFAMAQETPSAVFKLASVAPEVDGVVDAVWAESNVYNIERSLAGAALPTVGDPGQTTWKGLYTSEGVYVLLQVTDDEFYPLYLTGVQGDPTDTWDFDKPEIYFDVNYVLQDALGAHQGQGHYQFAPEFVDGKIDGTVINKEGYKYADVVDGSNYVAEYFIPFTTLLDKDNAVVDLAGTFGFDVTIIDRDHGDDGRRNALWANTLPAGAWDNMDGSGTATFDGVAATIDIETLAITGGTEITTDNGTLTLSSSFTPLDATQKYKWVLTNGTGMATINNGVVTALRNGTVTVKTSTVPEFTNSNEITITISGQKISIDEINMIKNGNFDKGTDSKENWVGSGVAGAVVDGENYINIECTPKEFVWSTMLGQAVKVADATTNYILKFKAKASADMAAPMFFEDRGTGFNNNKVLTSSSQYRVGENWLIPLTTEDHWFTIDVIFSAFQPTSAYELNFQLGLLTGTFSIDSVQMYTEADLALVYNSSKTYASNKMSVYPNPAVNELTVSMSTTIGKVAIYNALGQKMMERVSTDKFTTFNVSSLRKGLYFVKLSDGTTQKFIK